MAQTTSLVFNGGVIPSPSPVPAGSGKAKLLKIGEITVTEQEVQVTKKVICDPDSITTVAPFMEVLTSARLAELISANSILVLDDGTVQYLMADATVVVEDGTSVCTSVSFLGLSLEDRAKVLYPCTRITDELTLQQVLEVGEPVETGFDLVKAYPEDTEAGTLIDKLEIEDNSTDPDWQPLLEVVPTDQKVAINEDNLREAILGINNSIDSIVETIDEMDVDSVPRAYLHSTLAQSAGDNVTTSTNVNVFAQDALEGDCFEFEQTTTIDDTPFGYVWIEPGTYLINAAVTLQWVGNPRGTFIAKVGSVMGENFDFSQEQEISRQSTRVVTIPNRMKLAVNVTYDAGTPVMGFWIQSMQVVKLAGGMSQTNVVHDDTLVGQGSVSDPLGVDEEKIAQSTLAGNLAPAFVPNSTTTIAGRLYMYDGLLYRAKENYTGVWDANKFNFTNLSTLLLSDIRIPGIVTRSGIDSNDHIFYYVKTIPPSAKYVKYPAISVNSSYGAVFLDENGDRMSDSFKPFHQELTGTLLTAEIPDGAVSFLCSYIEDWYAIENNKPLFNGVLFFGDNIFNELLDYGGNLGKFTSVVNRDALIDPNKVSLCYDRVYGYSVNYSDGTLISNDNYWYCDISIPKNSLFVTFRSSYTLSTNGVCFLDGDGNYISGYFNKDSTYPTGTKRTLVIPDGAATFRYSYQKDSIVYSAGRELFDCVYFSEKTFIDAQSIRLTNGIDARDGGVVTSQNLFHIITPIPSGAKSVYTSELRNSSYAGCVFFDKDMNYLSGHSNTDTSYGLASGNMISRAVPNDAVFFGTTYLKDSYAIERNSPLFGGIWFEFDKMHMPTSRSHCFTNKVHKKLLTIDDEASASVMDTDEMVDDLANIQLPKTYSADGKKTRLVIYCHGAGAQISKYMRETWVDDYQTYWTKFGYAVLDVMANPVAISGGSVQHYGHPGVVECYRKGYEYVMEHFNLYDDGVIVVGSSMGGLSSFQVVDSGIFPVLCQIANCPCIDIFKQAYCNPWINDLRLKLCGYFNFEGTAPTFTTSKPPSADEINYFVSNFAKTVGFYPILRNVVSGDISSIFDYIPSNVTALTDATEKAIYDNLSAIHKVPVIIFHCENDTTVAFRYSKYWVDMVRRGGCLAYLRAYPSGGHAAWAAGNDVAMTDTDGNSVTLKSSQYEAIQFARRYE